MPGLAAELPARIANFQAKRAVHSRRRQCRAFEMLAASPLPQIRSTLLLWPTVQSVHEQRLQVSLAYHSFIDFQSEN